MPRWLMFVVFFAISLLILGGVHYYFYRWLVVAPALPPPWNKVARAALVALTLGFPVSFVAIRGLDIEHARVLLYPIYIWMGVMLMLFFLLLSIDVLQGVAWLMARVGGPGAFLFDPARRLQVLRVTAGAAVGTVALAAGYAVWHGLRDVAVRRVEVTLPGLPKAMDGFSIAQLTDLHIGSMRSGDWVGKIVDMTNGLGPDLIAVTGDLADASPDQVPREVDTLRRLSAPHGVFFVTGNHEYFYDLQGWLARLQAIGVRVLRNERTSIGEGDVSFDLAGVDDHDGQRFVPGHGSNLDRATEGRDPARALVLLAHQPRVIRQAAEKHVGLVLSGHTHGGQIWPWNYLVYLQQPYVDGLHDHGGTQIYVSQGTGFWGPPMRLGSTAEITLIILRSPQSM